VIAVQGLVYVRRITERTSHPLGAAACLSLLTGAAFGPGFSRGTAYRPQAWRLSTTSPTILQRLLRSHGVAGEFAAMGGATILLERTRTICIGYDLIAGME
jgi:hypothetical protein